MKPKLSIMTKACASTDVRHEIASVVTFVVLVATTLAAGCSANRCHCHQQQTCVQPCCCTDAAAPMAPVENAPHEAELESEAYAPQEADVPFVTESFATTPPTPTEVVPEVTKPTGMQRPEYGHGKDYRWLIGTLQRLHVPRDGWKIRYAPIDQQDRWGGSVVLAPDQRLQSFQDGDTVYVEGEILMERASLYLSGPRYRISKIRDAAESDLHRLARDNR